VSVLRKLNENINVSASFYRAFRAPTLNELYRSFRVGNVVTQANPNLLAERLTGGEVGSSWTTQNRRLTVRGSLFWADISSPIANVTLSVQPNLITRQRQNLGSTRSRGVEFELDGRLSNSVTLTGAYQFADAQVLRFPTDATLEGLLIPHVPRNALTFQARYAGARRFTAALQGRFVGKEFDDDQNQLELHRYFELDATVARQLGRGVELFAATENLLDAQYDVARTPVRTIGPPIMVRAGIRFSTR
jgi:outer membrane receptor protein involved in Fe transport